MNDKQCIFCNLGKDKEIIAENDLSVAFYDGFPVNPGHALIICNAGFAKGCSN